VRNLICEFAGRGRVVLFSSHELDTVERVCSRVLIIHKGKIVADNSIERLGSLMALSKLEDIFSQLAIEQNTADVSRQIADLILA
jgi:ABC-2 type transport system ATP-binding protein